MREFSDDLKMHSVKIDLAPLETLHIIGKCERHGGIWQHLWCRTVTDAQVSGEDEVEELGRKDEFSPSQWVLGSHEPAFQVLFLLTVRLNVLMIWKLQLTPPVPWLALLQFEKLLALPMYDMTQGIECDVQSFVRPVQVEAHFQWDRLCIFDVEKFALANIPTFLIACPVSRAHAVWLRYQSMSVDSISYSDL